jgi:hypothetical protein
LQRIVEAMPLIPADGALTGWPAAYLAAVTSLDGRDSRTMQELPLPVCLGRDVGREHAGEWRFLRDRLARSDVVAVSVRAHDTFLDADVVLKIRTTVPNRAAFDGIREAGDLAEAVALVDACANAGWIDLGSLSDYVATRSGARRVRSIRRAVALADGAARSTWESRLRVFYVTVAGLPRPRVNVPIFDVDGRLLGIADLFDEKAALVTEFDGRGHRERHQHRADNDREEWFEDAGLTVTRADSLDMLHHEARLVTRLRSGYRRGMQRDRSRDRWTTTEPAWWTELHGAVQLTDEEKAGLFGA